MRIMSVAYPFAPVREDTPGGAEQVLRMLDEYLIEAGHESIVAALRGSEIKGKFVPTHGVQGIINDGARKFVLSEHGKNIETAIKKYRPDVVHMHGLDFHEYLPSEGVPVLATLHLPLDIYAPQALKPQRKDIFFNCVSRWQHGGATGLTGLLEPVLNGIKLPRNKGSFRKRPFTLMLGRVCAEKGYHLGVKASIEAGFPAVIAGKVFDYPEHRQYFDNEIKPHLNRRCRFIGVVGGRDKARLLSSARCLLVPSLLTETSSLSAMEAIASGTPVVAFRRGALTEIVDEGKTGFLVDTVEEMAGAISKAHELDPLVCAETGKERFSSEAMGKKYIDAYRLISGGRQDAIGKKGNGN